MRRGWLVALLLLAACTGGPPKQPTTASPTSTPVAESTVDIQLVKVPNLVNLSTVDAAKRLLEAGSPFEIAYEVNPGYAPGTVLSQLPDQTTSVAPGTVVTLIVAKAR